MSSLSSQKGKEFIKELQELGESEERNEAPTAAQSAYEDALSVAIEIGAVEKIPILASCCSRLCFHTKNYTQSIGFANICTYHDPYFQEAFWWMYKSNVGNKDHKNALKCLVCGFNAASEEASQKKFHLELAVRIPDLLPSVENREILKGLSNPTEDEAFLVSTLEKLSIDGRWLAVSLLVTGYHLGPKSCLDNCAHNCVAKSLSVGRLLKCLNAEELKTWGMYLAVALLKNKAPFETVEECFASPVLHVGVKLALTTGITGLVELMIKQFRKRSKKLREKDNDGKTAYQFLTKCTDPLSQTYTRLESLLKNICHKEEGAKAETDILSRRPDTKTNTNDMCCEYKKIATDLFQEGRYSKAILKYKKSISYTTDRKMLGILYGNIAECCLKLRQFQDAEKYGQESIKNDQSLTKSYVRVGRAMSHMERYEEAIQWFLTALRKDQSFDKRASILTYYTATAVKMKNLLRGR